MLLTIKALEYEGYNNILLKVDNFCIQALCAQSVALNAFPNCHSN